MPRIIPSHDEEKLVDTSPTKQDQAPGAEKKGVPLLEESPTPRVNRKSSWLQGRQDLKVADQQTEAAIEAQRLIEQLQPIIAKAVTDAIKLESKDFSSQLKQIAQRVASVEQQGLGFKQVLKRLSEIENLLQPQHDQVDEALTDALMGENWLGGRLLAHLRASSSLSVTQLATRVNVDVDIAATTMARLVRYGTADTRNGSFIYSERGLEVLHNIEEATGVNLETED